MTPYRHVEIECAQASKRQAAVCGDLVWWQRAEDGTTVLLCDGLGSGIRAQIAASLCAARLRELMRLGFSMRRACESVVATMHEIRSRDIPFSAFAMARVLKDGAATVLTYEMPPPVFVDGRQVQVLEPRFFPLGGEVIGESLCTLTPERGLLLVSDGVTQAGLGSGLAVGWTEKGVEDYVRGCLAAGLAPRDLPARLLEEARALSGGVLGDDTTAVALTCRPGRTIHVFTGPPRDRADDRRTVTRFLESSGVRIVCGSTTAEIVGRVLGVNVELELPAEESPFDPPRYRMDGIDLVTEGAMTLNQVYNLLDEGGAAGAEDFPDSGVTRLCALMRGADAVRFWVGLAQNPAHGDRMFNRMGILPRARVVELIAEKLTAMGKLVVTRRC